MNSPETEVAWLGLGVVGGIVLWRWLRAWFSQPPKPDPWGPEVTEILANDEARPLCPHCQLPHEPWDWFCPECGAAVGAYNTLSPYLYIFSLGEVLHAGTHDRFRANWVTLGGYLVVALIYYLIFAPVYWFLLYRNLRRHRPGNAPSDPTLAGPTVGPT